MEHCLHSRLPRKDQKVKRVFGIILILCCAVPGWSAKKTSIQELQDILIALQTAKKDDFEVATRLKEVDLSEELTRATMNSLAKYLPGEQSTEQMYVLEGRSAILRPPATDLPSTAPLDTAAQKALLDKASSFVNSTYMKNPHLAAMKTTSRFQDGVENIRTNSGVTNNMANSGEAWQLPNMFMRYLGTHTDTIETDQGIEKAPVEKEKVPWGINGQVSEGGPGLPLNVVLQEANDGGKIAWLRWETVGTRDLAVFSFSVPKKKSRYEVHYCCFPVTEDTGRLGYEGTGANMQTGTTWKDFKTSVGFHGELFIDPTTGAITRLVTQAELKPTDFVHQEDIRIDFGPVPVGGQIYLLPLDSFTITEVVPNGDNYAARYSVRHTIFTSTYKSYQPAEATVTAQK
jgi:hypothetical protein